MWLVGAAPSCLYAAKPAATKTLSAEEQQQFLYYFYQAHQLIQKDSLDTAWELMQFCHELNPNDACVNNYMGMFYDAMDRPKEALPYFKQAFKLQPDEYWHQYSISNEKNVLSITQCGCFFCQNIFDSKLISEHYINDKNGKTAVCPLCGVDAILPDNVVELSTELLENMYKVWFK